MSDIPLPMSSLSLKHTRESNSAAADTSCDLCNLPVGRARLHLNSPAGTLSFCCPGCLHVFQILFNTPEGPPADFRATELFRRCMAAGLVAVPAGEAISSGPERIDPPDQHALALETTFRIEGMWCAACTWLIEAILGRTEGVLSAKIDFLSDRARIKYLPHRIHPGQIAERINAVGYRARPEGEETAADQKDALLRLGVAAILTCNAMMISFALYGGFFADLGRGGIGYLSFPLCMLATTVVFYSGGPILRRAWQGLRRGIATMDTLIAVGSLAAYGYSVFQMLRGGIHLYFDTAAMLITLVLLGRLLESRARFRVTREINELQSLASRKVRLWQDGRERWVAAEAVSPGDIFAVEIGERVAADGKVQAGSGDVDESVLTGEPRPVGKEVDDEVLAGSLLLAGGLQLIATRVGPASSLGQMLALVREALAAKNPIEQFTDRITRWFVPLIFGLAAATLVTLLLLGAGAETAMLRAVTVLVIACPCALGIATPLAKVAVVGKGKAMGIVIRDASAFEQARKLDIMILDKTGTVTEGHFSLRDLYAPAGNEVEALGRAAAVEQEADHFLAREIRRQAKERGISPVPASGCRSFPGWGVAGYVAREEILVGNRQLLAGRAMGIPPALAARAAVAEEKGLTVIFVAWQGKVQALLAFGDPLKQGMGELVALLRKKGLATRLVSGDSHAATAAVAGQLGIERFAGQCLPADKAALVRELQAEGLLVGMVGDGVNDAAALAQADVGFAVGSRPAALMAEAADVTLLGDTADRLPAVLDLSTLMIKAIRQNLLLAFLYNGIGIPFAMLGLLNPLMAVFAMFASSLTVIGNTLRIARMQVPQRAV